MKFSTETFKKTVKEGAVLILIAGLSAGVPITYQHSKQAALERALREVNCLDVGAPDGSGILDRFVKKLYICSDNQIVPVYK